MKIHNLKRVLNHGSALIGAALIALIVGGTLATYLLLVSGESQYVARSQSWNSSMTIAESGIEEALACINQNVGSSGNLLNWYSTAITSGWDTNNQSTYKAINWKYQGTSNTWASTSGTIYHIKRYLDSTNGYYDVYINNSSNSSPEILSIGTANWTTIQSSDKTNVTVSIKTNAVRKIYLKATTASQGGNDGVVAYSLTFNGNNVSIDSFNSSVSSNSIWKTNLFFRGANYGIWSNSLTFGGALPSRTANVHVAAMTNYIDVGNANIYGYINTAPGGTKSIGSKGSVGDFTWVPNTSGLQSGHFRDDMNQTFTSLSLPVGFTNSVQSSNWLTITTYKTTAQTNGSGSNAWFWVQNAANPKTNIIRIGAIYTNGVLANAGKLYTNINNAGWILPNGDGTTSTYTNVIPNRPEATNNIYYIFAPQLNDNFYVDAPYTVLYASNGWTKNAIITLNTNADAFIYAGNDITLGNEVNNTSLARALTIADIQGKPINITASGNASGIGKFYIPGSSFKMNGGGSDTLDIIGEMTCNNATFDGHFNLHFDESLATNSVAGQFTGINWREVQ